ACRAQRPLHPGGRRERRSVPEERRGVRRRAGPAGSPSHAVPPAGWPRELGVDQRSGPGADPAEAAAGGAYPLRSISGLRFQDVIPVGALVRALLTFVAVADAVLSLQVWLLHPQHRHAHTAGEVALLAFAS